MKSEQKAKMYLIFAILCAVFIVILIGVAFSSLNNVQKTPDSAVQPSSASVAAVPKVENTALTQAMADNPDTVAWLSIPGTDINNPVLQTTDNDYYLTRDERKEPNEWGCYFADYYATLRHPDKLAQNTVIYGHTGNTEDENGQRFSQLFRYLNLDFLQKNRTMQLTVGDKELTFEIFAVFYTDIDFYYIDPNPSDQGFDTFLQEVNARNEYVFDGVTVTEQDKLLTLSGCAQKYDTNKTGNHRFVVMAKLLPDAAASSQGSIRQNEAPKRPS